MVDSVERDSVHLHKFSGELQFQYCLKNIVTAGKSEGADLFEFSALEIAEVVSVRNKIQDSCKERGKANSEETVA